MSTNDRPRIRRWLLASACALAASPPLAADPPPTILTFDEPEAPFQSVDDLSMAGAVFGFKINNVDSSEAFYNSFGPGTLTHVTDPSLTGDAEGVLSVAFEAPTSLLEFGVALNTATPLTPGVVVNLYDEEANLLSSVGVDVTPTTDNLAFSEGLFAYSGAPVKRAVLQFALQPGSFAIDNLTYQRIPEPASLAMACVLILACLVKCVIRTSVAGA